MKKKVITLLTIFVIMHLGQGCRPEHFEIVDIMFEAARIKENKYNDKQQIVYSCTSSIKDKLVFIISYNTKYLYGQVSKFNFGNVCYATTVPHVNGNQLLKETFSITFDKPFSYYGETIQELTNIFEIENIVKEIDEYENYMAFCGRGADMVLDFSDTFFKNAVFEKASEYTVTFSCKTSDERFFKKNITITFE